jgi:hypothetical protein
MGHGAWSMGHGAQGAGRRENRKPVKKVSGKR